MYAGKAMPRPEAYLPKGPKPVFIRADDIRNEDKKQVTGEEIYVALAKVLDSNDIAGIQQIRRLWRIYLKSQTDRIKLISSGLMLRGASIPVYDLNPYTKSRDENLTRVVIKDIPLSLSDDVIRAQIQAMKYEIQGDIYRQKLRVNGQLTNCFNGDRMLYITPPSQPLPRKLLFGNLFMARVYHPGQPENPASGQVTCSRCLESGHHVSRCNNDLRCQVCKQTGHMKNECPENRQALRNNLRSDSPPRQPTAREETDDGGPALVTPVNENMQLGSRTRQTRLADFVQTIPQRSQRNNIVRTDPDEVMDLRSPMRTRSASRSGDPSSAYASDGAIGSSRSQKKLNNDKSETENVTRDDAGNRPAHLQSDFEEGIATENTSSDDEESSLSAETPPKSTTGKGKSSLKRKKKTTKGKK